MEVLGEAQPAHQVAAEVAPPHLDPVGIGLADVADGVAGLTDLHAARFGRGPRRPASRRRYVQRGRPSRARRRVERSLQIRRGSADKPWMHRRFPESALLLLAATVTSLPVVVLWQWGGTMVMPPLWVHFYGVGVSALVAAAAAVALLTVGARRGDARTVVMAGGFTIMAATPRRPRARHPRRARRQQRRHRTHRRRHPARRRGRARALGPRAA